MSPARRPTPHRLGRDRREVAFAVACAAAVLLVTGVLLWILAPASDDPPPSTPPITLPASLPAESVPETATPDTTAPAAGAPETGTGETTTTVAGG